jgi:hypothetical protein
MNDQNAKAFVATLANVSPKQRAAAWAALTPKDCAVAWTTLTPHEREADAAALNEAWIDEFDEPDVKQRREELVERNSELVRKGLLVDYGRHDGVVVLAATKYLTAGSFACYEPHSLKLKEIYTHDSNGNEIDGQYWVWTEESFEDAAEDFRVEGNDRAAAIVDQLVATADNVPAESMSQYQEFWNNCGADLEIADVGHAINQLGEVYAQMMEELGRGEFTPDDATAFVQEFIHRAGTSIR